MSVLVNPLPTRLAAAIVAAGVVSAGSVVALPANRSLPTISADVANASVITDALNNLGDAVDGISLGSAISNYAGMSLPYYVGTVVALAAQTPSLAPSLLSWLVQYYVNPSSSYPYNTLAQNLKYAIDEVANVLPPPLGGFITNATTQIANGINNALSGLPSPTSGANAIYPFWNTDPGKEMTSLNDAVTGSLWMLQSTVSYLGYLPADVEASVESAIQNPSQIPGLVSNLVYGLLSPNSGLFADLFYYATAPLTDLPGPTGQLATNVVAAITAGVNNLLALLPAPITPTPFPASATAAATATATSLPAASVTVPEAITLPSTSSSETPSATTDLKVASPQDLGASEKPTPQPAAPTADPGADPTPPTNVVRSGNKVKPGDTFGVKGNDGKANDGKAKDKGDGTAPVTTGTGVEPGTPVGSTNAQDSPTATTTTHSATGDPAKSSEGAAGSKASSSGAAA